MKKLPLLSLLLLSLVYTASSAQDTGDKKVVFVIVDGISADQLKNANTPHLDAIAKAGSYSDAYVGGDAGTYSETPTISAVGYNSLLTGTWANKHNVWGNGIKEPNYNYPTIFRLAKDVNPDTNIAVFSSWLDNRTKLVGDGLEATNKIKVDISFDGLEHDTINYPHDKERNFMRRIDEAVTNKAATEIKDIAPDISWVYLEFSDDMGHMFGDSPQFEDAIAFEDAQIGKIWEAIQQREATTDEEWLLIVTTDHGRSKSNGKGHGGQSDRERSTWVITNTKNTNKYFKTNMVAVTDILPTMVDFLEIKVPATVKREWDGVSLIQPVDVIGLKASKTSKSLDLQWQTLTKKKTKAKIYVSSTNKVQQGGKDKYTLVKTIDLSKEAVSIPLSKISAGFNKVVLETPNTTLNTWLVAE